MLYDEFRKKFETISFFHFTKDHAIEWIQGYDPKNMGIYKIKPIINYLSNWEIKDQNELKNEVKIWL